MSKARINIKQVIRRASEMARLDGHPRGVYLAETGVEHGIIEERTGRLLTVCDRFGPINCGGSFKIDDDHNLVLDLDDKLEGEVYGHISQFNEIYPVYLDV